LPKNHKDISLFTDLPVASPEPQGFSPEQMIRCDECLRANPPTRVACLYCGASLPESAIATAKQKPSLRPLEKWEQGYNSVLLKTPADLTEQSMGEAADLLRLHLPDLQRLIKSDLPLPLARTAVSEEASLIKQTLAGLGFETTTVSDSELGIDATPPVRLRTIEMLSDEVTVHPTSGDARTIAWQDITLIVIGRLLSTQVELKERKGRGSQTHIVDSTQTTADEDVLDFYTRERNGGWRILANNFDFSCLAEAKKLMARQNFAQLRDLICERALSAERNELYNSLRRNLDLVWPSEQQTSSLGWRRERAGRYSKSDVATTTNEAQFTRYSRLCHFLKPNIP